MLDTDVRYDGLAPASAAATRAAKGASKKRNTSPEIVLKKALRERGLRGYRIDSAKLAGRPDVVFSRERVLVFCDGDFWHGRNLEQRVSRLQAGHNAPYWVAKIKGNVARDRRNDAKLVADGWKVLRFWETDLKKNADAIAEHIASVIRARQNNER